jgi:hypothetical protein
MEEGSMAYHQNPKATEYLSLAGVKLCGAVTREGARPVI